MDWSDWEESEESEESVAAGRRLGRNAEAGSLPPFFFLFSTLAPRSVPVILTKAKAKMKTTGRG